MPYRYKAQEIAITASPVLAGFVSFLSSATIAAMIYRSKTRLTKPYRRIVFIMCIYDMFHSIASMSSSFLSPQDSSRLWSFGNEYTCSVQGFLTQLSVGSPLYLASLSIFYLCVIKYNMKDDRFEQRFEPYLHIFPNFWAWSSSIILVSMGYFNHAGSGCWIAAYPQGCTSDPDVDCVRGRYAFIFRWVFTGIPILICFAICTVIMFMITTAVGDQTIQNQRYRSEIWRQGSNNNERVQSQEEENRFQRLVSSIFQTSSYVSSHEPQANNASITSVSDIRRNSITSVSLHANRPHSAPRHCPMFRRQQEVKEQAIFFIAAFLCTYSLSYINRIVQQVTGKSPFWLHLMARTLSSFQGFFNILVYTRPHVAKLRRTQTDLSWFGAFWAVVKKGGDNDTPYARRNSLPVTRHVGEAQVVNQQTTSLRPNFGQAFPTPRRESAVESNRVVQQKPRLRSSENSLLFMKSKLNAGKEMEENEMDEIDRNQGKQKVDEDSGSFHSSFSEHEEMFAVPNISNVGEDDDQ